MGEYGAEYCSNFRVFCKKGNKYLMLHRGAHKRIMPDVWMAPAVTVNLTKDYLNVHGGKCWRKQD